MEKRMLKGMSLDELLMVVAELDARPYAARQIYQWLYQKNALAFDQMTNLSATLRQKLNAHCDLNCVHPHTALHSRRDASVKYLFRLNDGLAIESVYMVEERRRTVCLSTQVGCPLRCAFCATGAMGFRRNLSAGEIIDQLLAISRAAPQPVTNVVFMGMGEPFLNYENVIRAAQIINSESGPAIAARHITISSAGWIPGIERFTSENQPFKLALSLNATTDAQRDQLLPINRQYSLPALLQAALNYTRQSRRRVTFEYILIAGVNDSLEDARRLVQLLSPIPCKLNLIPFNENPQSPWRRPSEEHLNAFIQTVYRAPFAVTVRRSKGTDIAAACGQLYASRAM